MELYDVMRVRRSIRKFSSRPVEKEKLDRVFEAVRIAPSACNYQPWRFCAVQSGRMREKVEDALRLGRDGKGKMSMAWVMKAPLIIIGLGNRQTAWKRFDNTPSHVIDVTIAMEHIILAATNEGLGTCWICAFDQNAMHKALGLDGDWEPVALTPLGYADEAPAARERKAVTDIVEEI